MTFSCYIIMGVTLSFVFAILLQVFRNPYDFGFVRNWKIFLGIDNRKRFVSNRNVCASIILAVVYM